MASKLRAEKALSCFIARSTALGVARTKEVVEWWIADVVWAVSTVDWEETVQRRAVSQRAHFVMTWPTDTLCVICRPHAWLMTVRYSHAAAHITPITDISQLPPVLERQTHPSQLSLPRGTPLHPLPQYSINNVFRKVLHCVQKKTSTYILLHNS